MPEETAAGASSPERVAGVVAALRAAFAGQTHDMIVREKINASPLRHGEVRKLLKRDLSKLGADDLDALTFRSISTIGGVKTFRFVLPRFLTAMVSVDYPGAVSDSYVVLPKLEQSGFEGWCEAERDAILDGLELWAVQRSAHDDEYWQDDGAHEIKAWVAKHRGKA